jgi:hypothetical protein
LLEAKARVDQESELKPEERKHEHQPHPYSFGSCSTPLCHAAHNGQAAICSLLIKHKANPNALRRSGIPPLHQAAFGLHAEACASLLQHRANAYAADCAGRTALQRCRESQVASFDKVKQEQRRAATARVLIHVMNRAARAFALQTRCARAQHIASHWTDSPLFDSNLVSEITQYIQYV